MLGISWFLLLSWCSLLQFGSFGPRLLNDADAKRACIAVHIPLHHILLFVPIHHSSILSAFIIWAFPVMLTPHLPPLFCLVAFLIEGFVLLPFSLVCFCQRDTCCRILFLCRITKFSCLLNLLTTLNYFIPALFHHIFTQPHCISIHSHRSRSFPSSWVSVSLPTQCVYACTQLQERQESFIVQLFQYIQTLSHFPPNIDGNFIPSLPHGFLLPLQSHSLL